LEKEEKVIDHIPKKLYNLQLLMKTVLNKNNVDTRFQPLFLGEDLSLQRYDKLKYPKLYDLAESMEEYFWRPKEVNLLKDRTDYMDLSDSERFVFDKNLQWQTMTDSMLSRSIFKMSEYVTNPELEAAMNVWAFFESNIHSRSYSHILKNVFPNESVFWDSILQDKEICNRADEAKKEYDKLFGSNNDIKTEIFNSLLSTQITEGLAFYTSFVCSFFFGAKGKMEGNSKIIKLIARDENLHVAVTQNVLSYLRDNEDEGFQHIVKANEQKIYDAYGIAVETEKKWADYLFSNGGLLGLNAQILKSYVEWLANNRLTSLGYKKIFDTKKNPLGSWYDMFMNSDKVQVAPQETGITSYKIGARNTQVDVSEFSSIEL
jgi:ribonucleoside-diphosphate reductase beta chain